MVIHWGMFSAKSKEALKAGWLITAGVVALYVGIVQPRSRAQGIAAEKGTGLAALSGDAGWGPVALWRQSSFLSRFNHDAYVQAGIVGGVAEVRATAAPASLQTFSTNGSAEKRASEERKLIRTASLGLTVKAPAETTETISRIAQAAGGFLESSNINGGVDATSASLSIRVPAGRFDEVRAQIRRLGLQVDNESTEIQDTTKQYIDQEARLRNLHAQEQQYLAILRKAATVNDTLEVSEKLNEVRGAIEERQAEFQALSKLVETVTFNITLRSEADARVFGLNWRPLYQLKSAARDGLAALADYAASMTAFVFYLPTILLWLLTILTSAAIGWRIVKRTARRLFLSPKKGLAEKVAT